MFSTARAMPVSCSRSATPSTNSPAYSFCQRNGGWSTTVDAPTSWARAIELSTLVHGSGPQIRWVSRSVGACTDTTGMPCSSDSAASAPASCETGSVHTITSRAS